MKLPPEHVPGKGLVRPTGYGGYGEKMLRSMGWEKGQGLGMEMQGIKEAIRVKKKQDNVGVGGRKSQKWDDNWWDRAFSASSASLSKLGGDSSSSSESASDASTSSDSDSDDSSEEEFALRTQRNRDGTASSASAQELALLSALTAADASSKVVAGRFGGREGKMARIRAQEAAAAAAVEARLGLGPSAAPASKTGPAAASAKAASSKPAIIIEVGGAAAPRIPAGWAPTVLQGWWGSSMFAPAGVLEGMRKAESGVKDKGFTEDDQEQVYTRAQESQRKGHGGLGQSRRTIKVDGQAWAGTRTRFEDEAEAPSEADAQTDGQVADAAPEAPCSSSAAAWAEEIKWKKVTSKFLKDAPDQQASLKKLRRHVAEHVRGKLGARPEAPGDDDISAVLHEKLVSSRQFVLQGKSVRLA